MLLFCVLCVLLLSHPEMNFIGVNQSCIGFDNFHTNVFTKLCNLYY
jgi:hypothetical protein